MRRLRFHLVLKRCRRRCLRSGHVVISVSMLLLTIGCVLALCIQTGHVELRSARYFQQALGV